jgi:hypothetical protein
LLASLLLTNISACFLHALWRSLFVPLPTTCLKQQARQLQLGGFPKRTLYLYTGAGLLLVLAPLHSHEKFVHDVDILANGVC